MDNKIKNSECEKNVKKLIKSHPGVMLILKAMKDIGCEATLERHFSCEDCYDQNIRGGFDSIHSQLFLCQNRTFQYKDCAEILTHELVHAFDYCRIHLYPENLEHIACTEIRAANLTSCSVNNSISMSDILKMKDAQKECVKRKAVESLRVVKPVSQKEALRVVEKVFEKCYADVEPFGRRISHERDYERAYQDNKSLDFSKLYKRHSSS